MNFKTKLQFKVVLILDFFFGGGVFKTVPGLESYLTPLQKMLCSRFTNDHKKQMMENTCVFYLAEYRFRENQP